MANYNSDNGLGVGYSVEDGIDQVEIDPRLPLLQDADLRDKVVLLRVDHNVVKKGKYIVLSLFHYPKCLSNPLLFEFSGSFSSAILGYFASSGIYSNNLNYHVNTIIIVIKLATIFYENMTEDWFFFLNCLAE